jgi:FlaA1/EpsC-like NDP-sugar epimerase
MRLKSFLLMHRRPLIVAVHSLLIVAAYVISFLLRFDFRLSEGYIRTVLKTIPALLIIKLLIFNYYHLFTGLWRYVNIDDIWRIVKASFLSTIAFIVFVMIVHNTVGYPRSIFLLDWILCTGLIGGVRFATRLFREKFRPARNGKKQRALIVGAGAAGVMVLRETRSNKNVGVEIVGFVDDSPTKKNLHIQGVKILGTRRDIPAIVKQKEIDELIIAMPSARGEVIRDIIAGCQMPHLKVKIVPGLDKILDGDLVVKPRDVKPEDLLGREAIKVDETEIGRYLSGKIVLVTGAGGSIGSEICRQIVNFKPKELILLDHNENEVYYLVVEFRTKFPGLKFRTVIGDIKDIGLLKQVFSRYRPEVVFHSAAHKHVPLMQQNPVAAVKNNILGSRNLVYAAAHYKVERFVLISTDKAVNPVNIMGMTKRVAEMIVQAKAAGSKTKFMAVRFGNVLGSAGSVVPLFKKQIEEGGPITITHPEAKRYFMSIREAVTLVLQAAALGVGGEIFILDMGEQINIVDIAKTMIALSGLKEGKDITIKLIGLRDGEKISEEIFLDIEKDRVTKNEKIFVTPSNHFDPIQLRKRIKELEYYANLEDEEHLITKLKELVPFGH